MLDDTTWLPKTIVLCIAHNFHEHSEFTSIFTSYFTSETSVNYNLLRKISIGLKSSFSLNCMLDASSYYRNQRPNSIQCFLHDSSNHYMSILLRFISICYFPMYATKIQLITIRTKKLADYFSLRHKKAFQRYG